MNSNNKGVKSRKKHNIIRNKSSVTHRGRLLIIAAFLFFIEMIIINITLFNIIIMVLYI